LPAGQGGFLHDRFAFATRIPAGRDRPGPDACWNPLHRAELECIRDADKTIVISEAERHWLESAIPGLQLALVPLVRDLPAPSSRVGFEDRAGIAFIGNFQHPPNVDAIRYFLEEIWPGIHRQLPGSRVLYRGQLSAGER
jgi:hypothetical protein